MGKSELDVMSDLVESFAFNLPDTGELSKRRRARFIEPLEAMKLKYPNAFNATSLSAWLALAKQAQVPHVESRVVASVSVDDVMTEEPHVDEALAKIRAELPAGHMLRWDCCAGIELKAAMQKGQAKADLTGNILGDVSTWDPRFSDLAYEFAGESIDVHQRPWVAARQESGGPVEYRVFVLNGEVVAVSNYYYFRPLVLDAVTGQEIGQCLRLSKRMLSHMESCGAIPHHYLTTQDRGFEEGKLSCTLDFIINANGEAVFLEAGPAFGSGAHPCGFYDEGTKTIHPVAGLALGGGVVMPLPNVN